MSHNIYELFSAKFAEDLTAPFLRGVDDISYNYGQVDLRSAAMVTVLKQHGAKPGDRVVAQVEKTPDMIALYFACLRARFVFVPLNVAFTTEEVGFALGDTSPTIFIHKPEDTPKLKPLTELMEIGAALTLGSNGLGTLPEQANAAEPDRVIEPCEPDDLAALMYTSGISSRPKTVMLSHSNLATNAITLHAIWRFRPGDILLHTLPVFHTYGLFIAMHCAILNRSELLLAPKFDAKLAKDWLARSTVMMGVPTYYARLLADKTFGPADCQTIRMFTSSSAPLTKKLFDDFKARTGHSLCQAYGTNRDWHCQLLPARR